MHTNIKTTTKESQESANKKQAFKEGTMDNSGKLHQPASSGKTTTPGKKPRQNKPANGSGI